MRIFGEKSTLCGASVNYQTENIGVRIMDIQERASTYPLLSILIASRKIYQQNRRVPKR